MNTFQENAENNWPEDEAVIEAEDFLIWLNKIALTERTELLSLEQRILLEHWQDIFENDSFLSRFITEFNKHIPDFCKIPEEMQKEFCKQDDLFS